MDSKKFKILFVCLGNYCRSPAAHAIMEDMIIKKNLKNKIIVDSCGTSAYVAGDLPDDRMRNVCKKRGIKCEHIVRRMTKSDLDNNDLIVVMDNNNYNNVLYSGADEKKVKKMIDFVSNKKGQYIIPDPYYGDESDFEFAVDLIVDGCEGILRKYKYI